MKQICKTLCLGLALSMLALPMLGCERENGLYGWHGFKMNVENVLTVRVDAGDGEKVYDVPFDTYRAVYVYLKNNVSDVIRNEEGEATSLATDEEKNAAVKEVTETVLREYYCLLALCEKYGISITDEDKQAYYDSYEKKMQNYVDSIDESEMDYDGTKEEYAKELYTKSLAILGMTPEYFEFSHYRSLLQTRLKKAVATDLEDYFNQSYYHYKQVMISYTKGDAEAESRARTAINEAYEKLLAGEDMDTVIAQYCDADVYSEVYADIYGSVAASSTSDTLGAVTLDTVSALDIGEISPIVSGDNDDYSGYFVIFRREGFDEDYICGNDSAAKVIYETPYVGASYSTPHYTKYKTLIESCEQNASLIPVSEKVYDRIAINTLY